MISKSGVLNNVSQKSQPTSVLNPKDKKDDTQYFPSSSSSGSTQVTTLFTSSTTSTTSSEGGSYFSASASDVQPIEFPRLRWENHYVDGDENKGFCKEYTKIAKLSVEEKIRKLKVYKDFHLRIFIISQLSNCNPTKAIIDILIYELNNENGHKKCSASAAQALAKLQPQDKILKNKIINALLTSLKDNDSNKASLVHELTAYSLSKLLPLDEDNLIIPGLIDISNDIESDGLTHCWISFVFEQLMKRYEDGEQIISETIYNLLKNILGESLLVAGPQEDLETKLEQLLDELLDPQWDVSSADISVYSEDDYETARDAKLSNVKDILHALKKLSSSEVEQFENTTQLCRADLRKNDPSKKNQEAINNDTALTKDTKNSVKDIAEDSRRFSFRHNNILNITWKKARAKVLGRKKYKGIKTTDGYDRKKLGANGTPLYNDVRKEWSKDLLVEFKRIQETYQFESSEFDDKADARLYKKLCSRQIRNKTDEQAAIHHVEYKAKTPDRAISTRNLMLTYDGHRNKQANGNWGSHGAHHQLMAIGEKDKMRTQSIQVLNEFKRPFMHHDLESSNKE